MVGAVTGIADCAAESSPGSPRETELLAVTLRLLQQHGYDRLTLDAVAATALAPSAIPAMHAGITSARPAR
jgi:AcrR family transcriptional regulator